MSRRILIVEDDLALAEVLALRLDSWGWQTHHCADAAGVAPGLAFEPDLVLSDVVLPDGDGLAVLRAVQQADARTPVVLMTAHATVGLAVEAMKAGAADFLTKPVDPETLRALLAGAEAEASNRHRAERLRSSLSSGGFGEFVGASRPMKRVYELLSSVAPTMASVLISGETGTGKELAARTLHSLSGRADGPFVAINCAALPAELIESEIFGHEAGAFTGARGRRAGCFEQADGGTLLLDEIAEMPPALQPKLLRVLEEQRVRRVGSQREFTVDVRVVAATNRRLPDALEQGKLRSDLFYRLSVFQVELPPLRKRRSDIALLTQHFIDCFNGRHRVAVEGADAKVLERLASYCWPGNVRELRNAIERAVVLAGEGWLKMCHMPPAMNEARSRPDPGLMLPARVTAAEAEKRLILHTLEAAGQNKAEAARRLDLDVKTIRNKLHQYGPGA